MVKPEYELYLSSDTTRWRMKKPHFHEDVEVLFALTGEGEFFVENELYPIRPGSLFLFSEGVIHQSMASGAYSRYVLHVSPETLREFSTRSSDIPAFIRRKPVRCAALEDTRYDRLLEKLRRLGKAQDDKFCADIRKSLQLLDVLVRVITFFSGAESERKLQKPEFVQITPVLRYIQSNIDSPITLDSLAKTFFISKYYLCHLFKSATGLSVMDYIINYRILRARELLRKGIRVQEAADRAGFKNCAHFTRTFKLLTGIPPKQYAKKYVGL
ncbi:MAG: AraC family transcriptional regulator [Spirochaetaceae bacterium]|jgi:AraC-like DNA-binding protein|nr:AraC family transcriptional regulator [Spirochaetaceae bacterium]